MLLTSTDPAREARREKSGRHAAGALPASFSNAEGLTQQTYPVRWLRGHYPLSPAPAKIIAAEIGWLEAPQ